MEILKEKEFKGDIVITDPQYLKSNDIDFKVQTLYGDISFKIGDQNFCTDTGEICVVDMSLIDMNVMKRISQCLAVFKGFEGKIELNKREYKDNIYTAHEIEVKLIGNINLSSNPVFQDFI